MNNKLPVYPPPMTTAQRNALLPSLRKLEARIYNTTTGQDERWNGSAWVAVGAGVGSFTPLTYLAPPTTNSDADQQAWITAFVADMIAKNNMSGPPTYVISGQVTGSVQNAITVELRDNGSNALLETVSTNGTGNYTFAARVPGVYKVIPAIAGHYFTPSAPVITLAANTVQNFVAAVATPSAETSGNFLMVMQNGGFLKMAKKSPFSLEATTFPAFAGSSSYGLCFANGFHFVPRYTSSDVLVYADGTNTLAATFSVAGVSNIFRVFAFGNRLLVVGSSAARFVDYNFTTHVATVVGASATALPGGFLDADAGDGKGYILHTPVTSPNRNLVIADFVGGTFTNVSIDANTAYSWLSYGNGKILVVSTSTVARKLIDVNSLAIVATTASFPAPTNGRGAFAQGKHWYGSGAELRWFDESGASGVVTFTSSPAPLNLLGIINDDTVLYCADNTRAILYRVNAATATEILPNLSTVGGISYLKN